MPLLLTARSPSGDLCGLSGFSALHGRYLVVDESTYMLPGCAVSGIAVRRGGSVFRVAFMSQTPITVVGGEAVVAFPGFGGFGVAHRFKPFFDGVSVDSYVVHMFAPWLVAYTDDEIYVDLVLNGLYRSGSSLNAFAGLVNLVVDRSRCSLASVTGSKLYRVVLSGLDGIVVHHVTLLDSAGIFSTNMLVLRDNELDLVAARNQEARVFRLSSSASDVVVGGLVMVRESGGWKPFMGPYGVNLLRSPGPSILCNGNGCNVAQWVWVSPDGSILDASIVEEGGRPLVDVRRAVARIGGNLSDALPLSYNCSNDRCSVEVAHLAWVAPSIAPKPCNYDVHVQDAEELDVDASVRLEEVGRVEHLGTVQLEKVNTRGLVKTTTFEVDQGTCSDSSNAYVDLDEYDYYMFDLDGGRDGLIGPCATPSLSLIIEKVVVQYAGK